MGIENVIAQFGKRGTGNAGAGIGYGIQMRNALQREREYEDRKNMLLDAKRAEAERLAEQKEMEYAKGGVGAILSMPQEQWQAGYAGFYDGAVKNGFDVTGMPTPDKFTPDTVYRLAAATGVAQPKANTVDAPSNVREYEFYQSLDPEAQKTYLNVKRASQTLNLGDRVRVRQPGGDSVDHMKNVPPQNTPEHNASVTRSVEAVKEEVKTASDTKNAEKRLGKAESAYAALTNNPEKLDLIYGRGESLLPNILRSQEGIDLMAQRDQFVAILRLAEVGQLKGTGPITENEQKMLGQAATVLLNTDISPTLAYQAANQAMGILRSAANRSGEGAQQKRPSQQIPSGYTLMQDANGNRAYVGPNGEIIEAQ